MPSEPLQFPISINNYIGLEPVGWESRLAVKLAPAFRRNSKILWRRTMIEVSYLGGFYTSFVKKDIYMFLKIKIIFSVQNTILDIEKDL